MNEQVKHIRSTYRICYTLQVSYVDTDENASVVGDDGEGALDYTGFFELNILYDIVDATDEAVKHIIFDFMV